MSLKFDLKPCEHIDRGRRTPRPTANTQNPYPKPKPPALQRKKVTEFKGRVTLETLRPIQDQIARIRIVELGKRAVVCLIFEDGSTRSI